jgi:nucleoside-diphosphate-sugar epimerase
MTHQVGVVAGALGIAGRALVEHLRTRQAWEVTGLSRRPCDRAGVRHVTVDLQDEDDCAAKLCDLSRATHIFYCAFTPRASAADEVGPNVAMLRNLVTTMERVAPGLRHVQVVQGTKWYGHHLGPYRTPAREDDPRHPSPNFYYAQQDWLSGTQRGKAWTWSALRPHCICGISVGSPMNHLFALSLHAAVSRALGMPLRFPGTIAAFRSIYQFTDARLLARAMVWAATSATCENRAFNLTNGEFERWENIWPALADCFGMEAGPVEPIKLADTMPDNEALWARLRREHGLQDHRLADLVDWRFADWAYSSGFDQMSSMTRARQAGWSEVLDTTTMFRELIGELVASRFIPPSQFS